jgi:hypothetical protein
MQSFKLNKNYAKRNNKDKFTMLSGRVHYSSGSANPHLFIYGFVFFSLSLHKFLLNLKLCMNIVYCIMYPFIFLNYFSCIFYGLWIIGVREYVRGRKHLIRSLGPSSSSGTWVGMRMLPASEYEAPIKG